VIPIRRVLRFGLVGLAGFGVDAGLLLVLHDQLSFGALEARLASISIALLTTWRLNRSLTFGRSGTGQMAEGARYGAVAITVAACNYGFYWVLLSMFAGIPPVVAAALATGAAMGLSFAGYSRLVFGRGAPTRQHLAS
jgi:putative flippase GtrA